MTMMKYVLRLLRIAGATALLLLAILRPALAASSNWEDLGGGKARLVAVTHSDRGVVEGFIEIDLNKGWKTYWKNPGDSGIAPMFDFSASNDLTIGEIRYPAPSLIRIPDSVFAGYKGNVRFVFEGKVEGANPTLSLNLLAGLCENICIPATASFEIDAASLNAGDVRAILDLQAASAKLPKPAGEEFGLSAASLDKSGTLSFKAYTPDGIEEPHLFMFPPSGLFPTQPEAVSHGDGRTEFSSSLGTDFVRDIAVSGQWEYVLTASGKAVQGKIAITE